MATSAARAAPSDPTTADVEAALAASRVLVAVSVESLDAVGNLLTLPQLRALVVVASYSSVNLATLAAALGVNPSSATRLCDRLVAAGYIERRDDPEDRRYIALRITAAGSRVVTTVMRRRTAAVKRILARMSEAERRQFATSARAFAAAAGEVDANTLWTMGWQT